MWWSGRDVGATVASSGVAVALQQGYIEWESVW